MQTRGGRALLERGLCARLSTRQHPTRANAALDLAENERRWRVWAPGWQGAVSGGVRRGVNRVSLVLLHEVGGRGRAGRVLDVVRLARVEGEHGCGVVRSRRRADGLGGRPGRRRRCTRVLDRVSRRRGVLQLDLLAVVHSPRRSCPCASGRLGGSPSYGDVRVGGRGNLISTSNSISFQPTRFGFTDDLHSFLISNDFRLQWRLTLFCFNL